MYKIEITKNELDLDKTLDSGQAFRWYKDNDEYWIGVIKDKICILKQYEDYIETNIDEEDSISLVNYLNLDMNYTDKVKHLNLNNFELAAYECGKGIHILRQDYFETMVTFLMSSCNTMNNIRNIVNKLCENYGDRLTTIYNNTVYNMYTFPTLETLSKLTIDELLQCKMGFRAKYLISLCRKLQNNPEILEILHSGVNGDISKYNQAINILTDFTGIGEKVANCISLFAGHHLCAFPIDTHIKQIIDKHYNGKIELERFGDIPGVIQQYLYYYKAFR